MKTTHQDIKITYDETDNRWHFELRGRQRSAESLYKAKEFIDKPVEEKEKPFKRVQCWFWDYCKDPVKAEITSVAETRSRYGFGGQMVNLSIDGKRQVEPLSECFPYNAITASAISEWTSLRRQAEDFGARASKLKGSLKPIKID